MEWAQYFRLHTREPGHNTAVSGRVAGAQTVFRPLGAATPGVCRADAICSILGVTVVAVAAPGRMEVILGCFPALFAPPPGQTGSTGQTESTGQTGPGALRVVVYLLVLACGCVYLRVLACTCLYLRVPRPPARPGRTRTHHRQHTRRETHARPAAPNGRTRPARRARPPLAPAHAGTRNAVVEWKVEWGYTQRRAGGFRPGGALSGGGRPRGRGRPAARGRPGGGGRAPLFGGREAAAPG